MDPWTLALTLLGWLVVGLLVAVAIAVVACIILLALAGVRTVRDNLHPAPRPTPGTVPILTGEVSDD